jgi:hypothetical protein
MVEIYRLSREGGAGSPRFKRYLKLIPDNYNLVPYNPMAGPHALETTEQLLAVDAERVAMEAASEVATLCEYLDQITLAVVLCSPGGWTDRLTTEIEHRAAHHRYASGSGLIQHWTRETPTAEQIRREATAEAVRVMVNATRARPESVRDLLHREGLAYALAGNPYGPVTPEDQRAVGDAVDVLGESEVLGDKTAVLYGDAAATALGWAPAGVAEHGGYRWSIDQAGKRVKEVGAPAALHERD